MALPVAVSAEAVLPADDLRRAYGRGYASCSETFSALLPMSPLAAGVVDFVCVMALAGDGTSVVIGTTLAKPYCTTARERALWLRVGAHLSSALRLRLVVAGLEGPTPESIHSPSETCHHATPSTMPSCARESLRRAVRCRERARTESIRADPQEALDLWRGLVDGKWSLVDREDSDGRRFVVAYRNAVPCAADLALSPREREVVQLIALGKTTKHAAYALGVSPSAISHRLRFALRKLRLGGASDLVRTYNHLRSTRDGAKVTSLAEELVFKAFKPRAALPNDVRLTPAEQSVKSLLLEGLSNRQIATTRRCAERTIANQVASILRKTGAEGRLGVIAKDE